MALDGVPQRLVDQNAVSISSSNALSFDKATCFEILNNSLHSAFRYPDLDGDFPQNDIGVGMNHDKHVRVIRQKSPSGRRRSITFAYCFSAVTDFSSGSFCRSSCC